MNARERDFFLQVARDYTAVACLGQTLAVDCRSSGHDPMASPADVEARLWAAIDKLVADAPTLRPVREQVRVIGAMKS